MAQRLLRALSPFRKRSAAGQKGQDAKDEDARRPGLPRDSEELERRRAYSLTITDDERKLRAARRTYEEALRAQLFAGREEPHSKVGEPSSKVGREEPHPKANGFARAAEEGRKADGVRTVGEPLNRQWGVVAPGKAKGGRLPEHGGLRQENGTGRFRYENGEAEVAHVKESSGSLSPVSPLTAAASSSSSSSPSLHEHKMNGTSSPHSDPASSPLGGRAKPHEGSFTSPLSGNPLLSTLSELSKNAVQTAAVPHEGGEARRPLARPLSINFAGTYNRERAESEEQKRGGKESFPRPPKVAVDQEVQKEVVKPPVQEAAPVKETRAEVKRPVLEVKVPEVVEEPEGPTADSPFRLTKSPIYMPPEPKPQRKSHPQEETDEVPWARDSARRGWAALIVDESTFNLPRLKIGGASSPEVVLGGGGPSPRFASPGVSPRHPTGSRSPRHAAPTRAVRGMKTPEKQPPKMRAPGSFAAPLVRKDPPGGGSQMQGFMRGTASSKVKKANAREVGKSRAQSTPRRKVQPPAEKKDDLFEGDKLLDFGRSFAGSDHGPRKDKKAPSSSRETRLHRSLSFPVAGVTPAEMAQLAALKAQLSVALQATPPRAPSKEEPPQETQSATPEALLKKTPEESPLLESSRGVGMNEPPVVPADVPLAAEAVFAAPLKTPKSPLKSLTGGQVTQLPESPAKPASTPSPGQKARAAAPRRSISPQRKPSKSASPKGPIPNKDEPPATPARGTPAPTGPPSRSPRSPSVKKPPMGHKDKPALEVDVPPRNSPVSSLLRSPGRGSPRHSSSSHLSPASSPSHSPRRAWGAPSLMSPTAASLKKNASAPPVTRSSSPSRLARSQSVLDEKTPSPVQVSRRERSSSLPVNLNLVSRLVKGRRSSDPTPQQRGPERRSKSPVRGKEKPAVPKRELTKKQREARRLSDPSYASSGDLVDLTEPTSLLPDSDGAVIEGGSFGSDVLSTVESGELSSEEGATRKVDEKVADVTGDAKADVNGKIDVISGESELVVGAEGKEAVAGSREEVETGFGESEAKDVPKETEIAAGLTVGEAQVILPGGQNSKEDEASKPVAPKEPKPSETDERALSTVRADVSKLQESKTEAPTIIDDAPVPPRSDRAVVFEDDSLEVLPGTPLTTITAKTAASSGGSPPVLEGAGKRGAIPGVNAKLPAADETEKARRRAEVANLLAALQEKEEIDYIARLVRRAQREKRQAARPEDDPPSLSSSVDSLASLVEKGGDSPRESAPRQAAEVQEKAAGASGVAQVSTQRRGDVPGAEKGDGAAPPEAGLAGWSKILGTSEVEEKVVWQGVGSGVSLKTQGREEKSGAAESAQGPEEKAAPEAALEVGKIELSGGVPEGPVREKEESRAEGSRNVEAERPDEASRTELVAEVLGQRKEVENASSGVDAKAPARRKESASISMPEKPARGAAEGPEAGVWDTYPSPTSPLDFPDDMQDAAALADRAVSPPVAPETSTKQSKAPRPDLKDPMVYIETALAHAGFSAAEPHPLPEWFSQTQVLNPALFHDLERQVDGDLLPTPGGSLRKGAMWRLSLDSTALRDECARPHVPRKEGYTDRRLLFDRMDEALGGLLAPHKAPPLGKSRRRGPLRRGPRGLELVSAVAVTCAQVNVRARGGGDLGPDVCSPQGVEELLQRCLPQAQRKWDDFDLEEAEVGVELEVGILDDLIGEAVQGFIAMERQRGGRRRVHPVAC